MTIRYIIDLTSRWVCLAPVTTRLVNTEARSINSMLRAFFVDVPCPLHLGATSGESVCPKPDSDADSHLLWCPRVQGP